MTRRRRVPLVPRVCIGVFLLLFSTVCADTTKEPPPTTERSFIPDTSGSSLSEGKGAVPNKIPLKDETDTSSTERKNGAINSSISTDLKAIQDELTKDAEAEDTEKVPIAIDEDSNFQGIKSHDQVDRLSTMDSANGGSKLEEIIYGSSGKSSSTKTISEDFSRLSRTNGLTPVTAKSSLDESKLDERKNKTIQPLNDLGKLLSKPLKDSEGVSDLKKDQQDSGKKLQVKASEKEEKTNIGLQLETTNARNDSTPHGAHFRDDFLVEKRARPENYNLVKNSEVPDLKRADDNKNDDSISLANDTNVNYSHQYKTTTERNVETKPKNQSKTFEGSPSPMTHKPPMLDPKDEVEVVSNVTHPASQRIVERQSQNLPTKDPSLVDEVNERTISQNTTKVIEIETKLGQIAGETSTSAQGLSSLVPRGRTIAFSGINEFPGLEGKPTVTSFRKDITERPYPYIKSSIKDQLPNTSNEVDPATEEPSALENTIGKGQSDEKFIVTEASDVLENSIQQFKPTYHEKVSNESSTVPSTEVRPSVPMTTASLVKLEETTPMNQTIIDNSNRVPSPGETSSSEGNDVPRWNEAHQPITGKGSFDVTGNGITEVTLKPETDKQLQGINDGTTLAPSTTHSFEPRTDPQNSDGSLLLLRSTLNATEHSTEYPLVKGNFSDKENTIPETSVRPMDSVTVVPTTIEETFRGNTTTTPTIVDINGNNEIPSGASGTLGPDGSFLPTTTSIEYEFVGLTESTTFVGRNSTEAGDSQSGATTLLPTVQNVSVEATTLSNEITTDSSTAETDVTTVDEKVFSTPIVESTTIPLDTTVESDRGTSNSGETRITTSATVDTWSTTTTDENIVITTLRAEQTGSKDSVSVLNVTESSMEFTTMLNVDTTEGTLMATSFIMPFIPSSLRPRESESSTVSTPTPSDTPLGKTDDMVVVTQKAEGITSLVRIDMEGGWYDVCQKMDKLKLSLAEVLRSGMNKSVSHKQIMFHQDPCQESPNSTPTPSDVPLTSILVYVVDGNGKFDGAMTKILPTLYEDFKERVQFPVTIHRILLVQEPIPDSGNAIAVVVVSSVAFICLVLLAGLLFIMRKRQTRFNYGERCRPVSLDAYSLDSVSAYNSVRRKGVARSSKRSYGNPTFEDSSAIPSHPLNFAGLSSFCNDVNAINEEFSGIPQVSAKIDELPTGAELKNRYANVIPLPETRVPLQKINNDPLTEYINASYVRGPKNAARYYVACQAPMESTVTDFWRMIWEQQCKVIIMLTDLVENGVEKCTEYVPPSEITDCHRLYGDHQVTLKKRETKEKYAISTLHLKNLENNTFREVYHIWYLWPVNGVQSDGAGLIAILLEARALQRGGPGPIVVHCSPGTGRTGTLIALDLGIRQYEITRTVDVPRVVYTIRRDRAGSVQTKEQYAFIYKALNLYATKLAGGVLEST